MTSSWGLGGNAGTAPERDFLGTTDNQPLVIQTNGVEAIRIDPGRRRGPFVQETGNVGIGTDEPVVRLHVRGNRILLESSDASRRLILRADGAALDVESEKAPLYVNNGGWATYLNAHGGDVGVGTDGVSARLHVKGDRIFLESLDGRRLLVLRTNGSALDIESVGQPLFINNNGSSTFLNVGGGRVGVGTSTPQSLFHVDGRATVGVLEITGGQDLAEHFTCDELEVEPGSVMVIDEGKPGSLKTSTEAYDTRVAGVATGANQLQPGLILAGQSEHGSGVSIALAGKVYVRGEALSAPIKPGDLLTTSAAHGCAMKATDSLRIPGALIGKAMSSLLTGEGLVLALVRLG